MIQNKPLWEAGAKKEDWAELEREMETLDYYNRNAEAYSQSTRDIDFHKIQEHFLRDLPEKGLILDFGCGSGRDSRHFLDRGFRVEAVDGSKALCRIAEAYIGQPVRQMLFQELSEDSRYDGIWACSSILHLSKDDLLSVFQRISRALRMGGILYTSFKYGTFSGMRDGRFFTDMTEESFNIFLTGVPELRITESWVSADLRPGREKERWLNLLLRKTGGYGESVQ